MPKPTPMLSYPAKEKLPYGPWIGYFDRATDPDTVVACVSVGFDLYPPVSIRLRGLRAPESHQIGADELVAAIERVAPYGTHCNVYSEKTPRSGDQKTTFARYVGDVVLSGNRDLAALVNAEIKRLEEQLGHELDPGL
ncbi:hypothetical protein GBA65_14835 [Rubrobacter marinus]|uniref:Uncharacterized protein n=1 Tax=Rubrobacter marinus TaxID=2653852 RepID=A0A6G8PZF8_9ACTN|nr:hypothetical protein [Rubrobacter marinus]QIN79582.1 hypothetical protein GBA65_14835 [Rubrobacter marinus]